MAAAVATAGAWRPGSRAASAEPAAEDAGTTRRDAVVVNRNPRSEELLLRAHRPHGYYHLVRLLLSNKHTTALVVHSSGQVVVDASTREPCIGDHLYSGGNTSAARNVALVLAQRMKEAGIVSCHVDTAGRRFHGKLKAFVEAIRGAGIETRED